MKANYISPKIKAAHICTAGIVAASPTLSGSGQPVDAGSARSKDLYGTYSMDEEDCD